MCVPKSLVSNLEFLKRTSKMDSVLNQISEMLMTAPRKSLSVQTKLFCEENFMRLCTFDELLANVAAGTGCGYDRGLVVWSSTNFGYWVVFFDVGAYR
eukprot:TRINITY_DN10728_c0_g1_i1.p1 TRINITY_DN10728_c0_g1~~TRINITY_DN10728_c0_g1_i1.p1  ORF type:complete len:98 (-),score=6.15 TRINITY_DN10728_c0_g1_i1:102-395(-)